MTAFESPVPLCVDLDGTLTRTDTLHELILALAKHDPLALIRMPAWLRHGKAAFKHRISERVRLDPSTIPYRPEVLELIAHARAEGRSVILVTAAPSGVAEAVAAHLGVFDSVIASDRDVNLAGLHKADALVRRFGRAGFDYIGNHWHDLPALAQARRGFLVTSNDALRRRAEQGGAITVIETPKAGIRVWVQALRLHQWLKNGLIFAPLLAAREVTHLPLLLAATLAFLSFSLLASSVYLINDLLDLAADRAHRTKHRRALASGILPIAAGAIAAPSLVLASLSIALMLPSLFLVVLICYGLITTSYSFFLKRFAIVDVMLLAGLYTVRILAGAAATTIAPSFWLLAFSMFIFFSLAMVKRYSELRVAIQQDKPLAGRGYLPADLPVVLSLGAGSGLIGVLILAFYTKSEFVPELYPAQEWLWLAPPFLLYWVARIWLKAGRGEVDDDPVVFAARDRQSLVIILITALLFALAGSGCRPW